MNYIPPIILQHSAPLNPREKYSKPCNHQSQTSPLVWENKFNIWSAWANKRNTGFVDYSAEFPEFLLEEYSKGGWEFSKVGHGANYIHPGYREATTIIFAVTLATLSSPSILRTFLFLSLNPKRQTNAFTIFGILRRKRQSLISYWKEKLLSRLHVISLVIRWWIALSITLFFLSFLKYGKKKLKITLST